MPDQNYRWNANKLNDPEDDLDRVIDMALAMYATVEAREGLEQRILANLRDQESRSHWRWWAWGLAAAVLATAIVAVAWHSSGKVRPAIANHSTPRQLPVEQLTPRNGSDNVARNIAPIRRHIAPRTPPSRENPKLDQFPSPHPMSEQERILAMYINLDPEHAALIAEARMEALRQDEAEKLRIASANDRAVGR